VRQQSAVLLHVPYLSSKQDGRLGANILPINAYFATVRLDQAVETTQERGFAGSTFSDERYGLAGGNVDAHIVERDHTSEVMRDIPRGQRDRHAHKCDSRATQPLSPALRS
jgi:hypothetical protein